MVQCESPICRALTSITMSPNVIKLSAVLSAYQHATMLSAAEIIRTLSGMLCPTLPFLSPITIAFFPRKIVKRQHTTTTSTSKMHFEPSAGMFIVVVTYRGQARCIIVHSTLMRYTGNKGIFNDVNRIKNLNSRAKYSSHADKCSKKSTCCFRYPPDAKRYAPVGVKFA